MATLKQYNSIEDVMPEGMSSRNLTPEERDYYYKELLNRRETAQQQYHSEIAAENAIFYAEEERKRLNKSLYEIG